MFKVMASSSVLILGSPEKLWDLLQPAAIASPAVGAKDSSYLTIHSGQDLLLTGFILVSGFGTFTWFSIPLGLCATMSLVCVVLQDTVYWPVSGGVTAYQINNSLILPLVAQVIMGTGGVVAIILMVRLYRAVDKNIAEVVAHASIATYDFYQSYINPKASDKQLRLISYIALAGFAIFSTFFATALNTSGVSMGWLLKFLGVRLGSAVLPIRP
ncbi:hypothetical protein G7Y89_g14814 [Cudoniella acicularis]|uniref:Uncharacterized protein n=1 Tax=Cudoniella acicularis TaxID=354080 RepID=A0A8H4VQW1_9HELO|nr:hypothetical protein G7Y89_g14814 [Cudoniella acicularis]